MHNSLNPYLDELESEGYSLVKGFFRKSEIKALEDSLPSVQNTRFCLDKIPALRTYAEKIKKELSRNYRHLFFNRSIFFNKSADKNWAVLWHQDLTVCVKEQIDIESYGPWSLKEGIPHVQAPFQILNKMITTRLHIDDTSSSNGALKVIPRSHFKIHSREGIKELEHNSITIDAEKGDLLLMKPLLLHSSESSHELSHSRRILHLEFLSQNLEKPLMLYHSQNIL